MDITFITIHDLSEHATILYCSDSIVDILGHTPDEVVNRSSWDFFHPHQVPFARLLHSRGVRLDKAAVLAYCSIANRKGDWVGCECCFSIVYDVMVCCTSIYSSGISSQKRAVEAPIVRKLFASSPKDPRYHMLSHLSSRFTVNSSQQTHEPRAALFLNRFTRTLTIMYATAGIEQIVGIPSEAMKGRSFYYCIQENCLEDAVRVLESAKGNDSIAYLRFFFRDPRQDDPPYMASSESEDDIMTDITGSEIESESGEPQAHATESSSSNGRADANHGTSNGSTEPPPSTSQKDASDSPPRRSAAHSSVSSVPAESPRSPYREAPMELEAVVSCTSDGLVVCLRRARPMLPHVRPPTLPAQYNGVYAAPWAVQPIFQPQLPHQSPYHLGAQHPAMAPRPSAHSVYQQTFMDSIRDVAAFAWALTGINGSLADYSIGKPTGNSQPPDGCEVWEPVSKSSAEPSAAPSGYVSASGSSSSNNDPFGDPGLN